METSYKRVNLVLVIAALLVLIIAAAVKNTAGEGQYASPDQLYNSACLDNAATGCYLVR